MNNPFFYYQPEPCDGNNCEGIVVTEWGGSFCVRSDTSLISTIDVSVYLCKDCAKNVIKMNTEVSC